MVIPPPEPPLERAEPEGVGVRDLPEVERLLEALERADALEVELAQLSRDCGTRIEDLRQTAESLQEANPGYSVARIITLLRGSGG